MRFFCLGSMLRLELTQQDGCGSWKYYAIFVEFRHMNGAASGMQHTMTDWLSGKRLKISTSKVKPCHEGTHWDSVSVFASSVNARCTIKQFILWAQSEAWKKKKTMSVRHSIAQTSFADKTSFSSLFCATRTVEISARIFASCILNGDNHIFECTYSTLCLYVGTIEISKLQRSN